MSNIIIKPGWHLPDSAATPERDYLNRRKFIKRAGLAGAAFSLLGCSSRDSEMMASDTNGTKSNLNAPRDDGHYPAPRSDQYTVDRSLTDEATATSYNNFYEFTEDKEKVKDLVDDFEVSPWDFEISGLVENPQKLTVDDMLSKLDLEERVYRFRCVEAWAMTVPWTGVPLKKLLELAKPKSSATHVRFLTFFRPAQAPNQRRATWYDWPYYEGLRLEEAYNELTMAVTGLYGKPLPKQNGAPLRIIVPWKYGYKNAKSIVKIELVDKQPETFWNDLAPDEYSFLSNVNPNVPHPRWSQASERLIGSDERVETRMYNGYGEYVADLYGS